MLKNAKKLVPSPRPNVLGGRASSLVPKLGFTLIEILVVIAIIGVLVAVGTISYSSARSKARDTRRKADLNQIKKALEIYAGNNADSYPTTGGAWWGVSDNGGGRTTSGVNAYIPGLTPTYVNMLPTDPKAITTGWSGFLYRSDGNSYKLLSHDTGPESFPSSTEEFYDPVRPTWAWMVCSNNATACNTW